MRRKRITLSVRKKIKENKNTSCTVGLRAQNNKKRLLAQANTGEQGTEKHVEQTAGDIRIVVQDGVLNCQVAENDENRDECKRKRGRIELSLGKRKESVNRDNKENLNDGGNARNLQLTNKDALVNEETCRSANQQVNAEQNVCTGAAFSEKPNCTRRSKMCVKLPNAGNTRVRSVKTSVRPVVRIKSRTNSTKNNIFGNRTVGLRIKNVKQELENEEKLAVRTAERALKKEKLNGPAGKTAVGRRNGRLKDGIAEQQNKTENGSNQNDMPNKTSGNTSEELQRGQINVGTEWSADKNALGELLPRTIIEDVIEKGSDFDEVARKEIKEQFADQMQTIARIAREEHHALLIFIDPYIESVIRMFIKTWYLKEHESVRFVDVDHARNETLYYELEDCTNFTFLITRNAMAIEQMERRIRSRFNNVKIFFGYLRGCKMPVDAIRNVYLSYKYEIPRCNFYGFLKLFKPLHIAIILCWIKKGLNRNKLVHTMKEFLFKVNEMKNVSDKEIVDAFYEVESTKIVRRNKINGDYYKLIEYVKKEMPFYLKRLI
ncbi:hypothetical protein THOM_0749 [Trachipleistophora hominis]|uniref:Uncharacterized protein n=1 Tax=Trachipleistophora hominis TaxID=72359 RepID=L7JXZ6_TRAHO|nr:hypothetical protein THOM_0749 [Trachipleistophora hominis]